ncbi:Uncharacterized protein OBRU01_03243, partial [Operophtera brumata]
MSPTMDSTRLRSTRARRACRRRRANTSPSVCGLTWLLTVPQGLKTPYSLSMKLEWAENESDYGLDEATFYEGPTSLPPPPRKH